MRDYTAVYHMEIVIESLSKYIIYSGLEEESSLYPAGRTLARVKP